MNRYERWSKGMLDALITDVENKKGVVIWLNYIDESTGEVEMAMSKEGDESGTVVSCYPNGSKEFDTPVIESLAALKRNIFEAIDHELSPAPSKKLPNAYRALDVIDDVLFKKQFLAKPTNLEQRAELKGYEEAAKRFKAMILKDIEDGYSTIGESSKAERARAKAQREGRDA